RVREAHDIATAIYENNLDKDQNEVKKLINDALRVIRCSKGRGYFFGYESNGLNVMHPILHNIQGKNLWDFQDVKGTYVIRNLSRIAKTKGEGFFEWWWTKPADINNEYEKIGFSKYFEPYDWFIGTGDYVLDYEEELKKDILRSIDTMTYGKNGYIFVVNDRGVYLSHIKKAYIGVNRINLMDADGFFITKEIIKAAKKGEDYISYIGTIKPSTGQPSKKTSYIKGFKDWNWAIGSGAYLSEIEEVIARKQIILDDKNKQEIIQIIIVGFIILVILFIISLFFANNLKNMFQEYRKKVEEKTEQLNDLNVNLEHKVIKRTQELKESNGELTYAIENLKNTQKKLVESEKMASLGGLVAGVAHEINTPVGVGLTGITHFLDLTEKIKIQYQDNDMSEENFEEYLETSGKLGGMINKNLVRTVELIKSFKQVAVDQTNETQRNFDVKQYLEEILSNIKHSNKKNNISIILNCDENIEIYSYPTALSQIINKLITNSFRHGFEEDEKGTIHIDISIDEYLRILYKDNGKGIKEENISKVFDPFFTTNRKYGGAGLGLNIIYNIITCILNGSIECSSEEGEGVVFTISIPIVSQ
ncbi:MAG: cache domain-containing protein, partial [Campylobacteraceae bacterium]|nr:cache domain-containing protein [Campylobacteraceae bacterium]